MGWLRLARYLVGGGSKIDSFSDSGEIWGSFLNEAEGKGVEPSTAFAATDFESAS